MNNLALCYSDLGRHADALELGQKTLARAKATLGPDHPYTLKMLASLARIYKNLDRHGEALRLFEEAVPLHESQIRPRPRGDADEHELPGRAPGHLP